MQPVIHCKYDELVKAKDLLKFAHPKNSNTHPPEQIARLKKIIEYQGFRYAVKRSNLSDWITTGHGRAMAGLDENWDIPVVWQDYEDEAQEFADLTADNAIASWAELDLDKINTDFLEFAPDLELDLLGLKDFNLDPWQSDLEALSKIDENLDGIKATIKVLCPQEIKDEVLIYLKAKFLEVSFEGVEIV